MSTAAIDPQEAMKIAKSTLARLKAEAPTQQSKLDFDSGTGEIWCESEIGAWGVTAKDFRIALRSMNGKRARIYLNSPGGSVSEGIAICNELTAYSGGIDTVATGVVASMASAIFMVGEKRLMASGTLLMIHRAWSNPSGNADDLEKEAEILRKHEVALVQLYQRSGLDAAEIEKLLSAETWLTSTEAIDKGFATGTVDGLSAKVTLSLEEAKKLVARVQSKDRSLEWAKGVQQRVHSLEWARGLRAKTLASLRLSELD